MEDNNEEEKKHTGNTPPLSLDTDNNSNTVNKCAKEGGEEQNNIPNASSDEKKNILVLSSFAHRSTVTMSTNAITCLREATTVKRTIYNVTPLKINVTAGLNVINITAEKSVHRKDGKSVLIKKGTEYKIIGLPLKIFLAYKSKLKRDEIVQILDDVMGRKNMTDFILTATKDKTIRIPWSLSIRDIVADALAGVKWKVVTETFVCAEVGQVRLDSVKGGEHSSNVSVIPCFSINLYGKKIWFDRELFESKENLPQDTLKELVLVPTRQRLSDMGYKITKEGHHIVGLTLKRNQPKMIPEDCKGIAGIVQKYLAEKPENMLLFSRKRNLKRIFGPTQQSGGDNSSSRSSNDGADKMGRGSLGPDFNKEVNDGDGNSEGVKDSKIGKKKCRRPRRSASESSIGEKVLRVQVYDGPPYSSTFIESQQQQQQHQYQQQQYQHQQEHQQQPPPPPLPSSSASSASSSSSIYGYGGPSFFCGGDTSQPASMNGEWQEEDRYDSWLLPYDTPSSISTSSEFYEDEGYDILNSKEFYDYYMEHCDPAAAAAAACWEPFNPGESNAPVVYSPTSGVVPPPSSSCSKMGEVEGKGDDHGNGIGNEKGGMWGGNDDDDNNNNDGGGGIDDDDDFMFSGYFNY